MKKSWVSVFGFIVLIVTAVSWAAPVPDTGQTKCYDVAGNVITCPSQGQAFRAVPMVKGAGPFSDNSLPNENLIEASGSATLTNHIISLYPPPGPFEKCNIPTEINSYNPGDIVMDWISFTGLQLSDTVTWKWYSPYGFYGSTTFIRDDIPSNPADSCICSYSTPDVTRIPGAWHIDVLYNGNFQFADYFSVAVSAANPTPGIKANRQDGELWVEAGTPVSISVNLAPGDLTGKLADWWIVVSIPSGIYSLTSSGWSPGINMLFQYQLVAFTPIEILNAVLPEGEYVFYFGVDTSPNSSLDLPLYFDSVNVKVVKSTPVNQLECKL